MHAQVIIPTLNHEHTVAQVIGDLPHPLVSRVIVVDTGSQDGTVKAARGAGAQVTEIKGGSFGRACLAGIRALGREDVVAFLPGGYQYHPEELQRLVQRIQDGSVDVTAGSRTLGECDRGSWAPWQRLRVAADCLLIRLLFRTRFTDLASFCAIRRDLVDKLKLAACEPDFPLALRLRALAAGSRIEEIPVRYRKAPRHPRGLASFRGAAGASFSSAGSDMGTILKYCWSNGL